MNALTAKPSDSLGLMGKSAISTVVADPPRTERASPATVPASLPASARIGGLDAARFVAAVAICWLHSCDSPELRDSRVIGTFGVPFYVFAATFFLARGFWRDPQRLLTTYYASRFRRLYLPFLAWSAIYLLARDLKHFEFSAQPSVQPERWMLFS